MNNRSVGQWQSVGSAVMTVLAVGLRQNRLFQGEGFSTCAIRWSLARVFLEWWIALEVRSLRPSWSLWLCYSKMKPLAEASCELTIHEWVFIAPHGLTGGKKKSSMNTARWQRTCSGFLSPERNYIPCAMIHSNVSKTAGFKFRISSLHQLS